MNTQRFIWPRLSFLIVSALVWPLAGCKESGQGPGSRKKTPPTRPAAMWSRPGAATEAPLGLPPVPIPPDNLMTSAKIELGKLLYFDTRLSKDNTVSCATCHDPTKAWAEHEPTSKGIHQQPGERNAPTVINAAYLTSQFWDGRAKSLEEQALGPIENPIEMGHKMETILTELPKVPEYQKRFQEVFGSGATREGIAKAIAAFERTILSGDSPYDRYKNGDQSTLDEAQKRGLEIFMDKGLCFTCHTPPIFSNGGFFNAGLGMDAAKPDAGRKKITTKDADLGKFRVAPLREVANTAPYFHNGSVATLAEAVNVMASGGKDNPNLSPAMKNVREAGLTAQDKQDLVAFLKALSGKFPVIEPPKPP